MALMKPVLAHVAWKLGMEQRALPFPSDYGRAPFPMRAGEGIEENIVFS